MKKVIVALVVALLAGCAAHAPLVDTKGVDQQQLQVDMQECQAYAEQTHGAGAGAVVGAVAGFALGQVLARTTGLRREASNLGRGAGVLGGVSGAAAGAKNQREVVQRCLAGRGYRVLN